MTKNLRLISMSDVQAEEVKWIWYPYIPRGKVTIIQGDPGEGKTTFMLEVISLLTRGEALPECDSALPPMNIIYQTAEDGLADTIRPRLDKSGADCSKVLVIDEAEKELTLCDERLEAAVRKTGAGLIVLDPLQAYLGCEVDMHRANEVRPIFKQLCQMAERTGCAVVLIGHMNKAQGLKASYRGLGSIDFRAAARSVLLVGRLRDAPNFRVVAHDKSSLAPEGQSIAFELNPETGFQWKGYCDTTVDELLSGSGSSVTKTAQMEDALREMLSGSVAAEEIQRRADEMGVSLRTLMIAKKNLGVISERYGDRWFWRLPESRM
jgi:archaellum biogenesis ATPase FlaH